MSYVALATGNFDRVADFYERQLRFPCIAFWDRPNGRGRRFDLGGGLRLEILDNRRERRPLSLTPPGERIHIVVEVTDIETVRSTLAIATPEIQEASWGALLFRIPDPDGIAVTFLEWIDPASSHARNAEGNS